MRQKFHQHPKIYMIGPFIHFTYLQNKQDEGKHCLNNVNSTGITTRLVDPLYLYLYLTAVDLRRLITPLCHSQKLCQ